MTLLKDKIIQYYQNLDRSNESEFISFLDSSCIYRSETAKNLKSSLKLASAAEFRGLKSSISSSILTYVSSDETLDSIRTLNDLKNVFNSKKVNQLILFHPTHVNILHSCFM